jgi:hypothetical protein
MKKNIFNVIFGLLLVLWLALSLLIYPNMGLLGLLFFGILVLLLLFLWSFSGLRSRKFKIIKVPVVQNLPNELKTLVSGESKLQEIKEKEESKYVPKYVASTEGESYHLRSCRFSKLIKKKYLLEDDDKSFFVKKKYPACKMCKPNKN